MLLTRKKFFEIFKDVIKNQKVFKKLKIIFIFEAICTGKVIKLKKDLFCNNQQKWLWKHKKLSDFCNIRLKNSITDLHCFNRNWNLWNINLIGKRSLDRISVDRNCVLSLDWNYVNHLIEFHLIKSVDRNFNNVILSYFKLSIKCQNP